MSLKCIVLLFSLSSFIIEACSQQKVSKSASFENRICSCDTSFIGKLINDLTGPKVQLTNSVDSLLAWEQQSFNDILAKYEGENTFENHAVKVGARVKRLDKKSIICLYYNLNEDINHDSCGYGLIIFDLIGNKSLKEGYLLDENGKFTGTIEIDSIYSTKELTIQGRINNYLNYFK